jgi:HAD superfamily hydrolase (TIGR01458 family)
MNIRGLLIDLDGVIYNDTVLIPGADQFVAWLQRSNIPFRFITNTTMKSRASIKKKLEAFGIYVESNLIFSAAHAAAQFIRRSGRFKCHLLLKEDARREFHDLILDDDQPDYVVVGDLGDEISFDQLNEAFQKLFIGADLIALQKNRYWLSDRGYTLDAGAFVALLEYAANKKSIVIGKPVKQFFEMVLKDLNLPREEIVMVGDDIESDIKGAQACNIKGVLVQSGKFRESDLQRNDVTPWRTIKNILTLQELLLE